MKTHARSAFTLVEYMIVGVIIMLLAAMFIPAYQKVRDASIVRAVESGERLSDDQMDLYREIKARERISSKAVESERRPSSTSPTTPPPSPAQFQSITVEGRVYYLVPRSDARETTIAGKSFWLVPTTP